MCDLTNVEEEDLEAMIYGTVEVIGAGRLAGTTVVDYDTIAVTVAKAAHNLLSGKAAAEVVEEEYVSGTLILIPYTTK